MGKNYCKVEHKWCKFCQHHKCIWNNDKIFIKEVHRCPKRESTRTIRLKDYIQDANIDDIMDVMAKYWPEEMKNKDGYAKVLEHLKVMDAIRCDWFIRVELVNEPEHTTSFGTIPEEIYLSCDGYIPNSKYGYYAIEFEPWKRWLGMNIEQSTLDSLNKNEILAGIFYEMTWAGFDEARIQAEHKKIIDSFNECKQINKNKKNGNDAFKNNENTK